MTQIIEQITQTDIRTLIFLIPFISLLHELEEWNILKWHRDVNTGVPDVNNFHVRLTLIFVVILNFVWTGISLLPDSDAVMAYMIMPLIAVGILNGFQHLLWMVKFRRYAPGVIFGFFLGVPVLLYTIIRILNENLVSPWYIIVCAVVAFIGIFNTIKLGAKIDPMIGKAMVLGASISKFLFGK